MTETTMIDFTSMHYFINMQNSKRLYQFKRNKPTYLYYEYGCFNNDGYDFKVKIVAGM